MTTVHLAPGQIELMLSIPERGMGYHLVDIELEDGTMLPHRVVVNSCELLLMEEGEVPDPKTFKSISNSL